MHSKPEVPSIEGRSSSPGCYCERPLGVASSAVVGASKLKVKVNGLVHSVSASPLVGSGVNQVRGALVGAKHPFVVVA